MCVKYQQPIQLILPAAEFLPDEPEMVDAIAAAVIAGCLVATVPLAMDKNKAQAINHTINKSASNWC